MKLPYNFTPRHYQLPIMAALDAGFKRLIWIGHRRSGKDKTAVNMVAKAMVGRVGTYYYIFPTYNQGRKILWDGIDKQGQKFLDHIPESIREGKPNETEMKIKLTNGSLFQIVGSDNIDAIVGTNPVGVVFSEYALQDPAAWGYIRPILAENEGWALFIYTPRGENHGHSLYQFAKKDPHWFCQVTPATETMAIDVGVLHQEKLEMFAQYGDNALYNQEYNCSFSAAIQGSYYGNLLRLAESESRIGTFPHEPRLMVNTYWDLGINDRMSVWFCQVIGGEIRFIDYMEGTGKGLTWYIQEVKKKPYVYGRHIGPHDLQVRELTSGVSRIDTARNLGFDFEIAPKLPLQDGIDAVRSILGQCWFDREKCENGLSALKSYRKVYDEKRKTYLNTPYHNWASNGADAFRYFAVTYDYLSKGSNMTGQIPGSAPDAYERERTRLRDMEVSDCDPMAV